MKKKFAIGAVFLITYVGFLIATLPASILFNQLSIPKKIAISAVTGSVWHARVGHVTVDNIYIENINSDLSFWSLFTLTPKLSITFGDPLINGPEGEFELSISSAKVAINGLKILVKANAIAQQLTLPLPMSAQGNVELTLLTAEIDLNQPNQCLTAKGNIEWFNAGVVALEQNIKLGGFTADISCEDGTLALILAPTNNLGLSFNAYVRQGGGISGNGFLTPGERFPQTLNNVLPFLGKKDRQGRYRLSF